MQSITVDVILGAVFGIDAAHDMGGHATRLRELVVELLHRCQSYSTMLPALRRSLAGRSPWARLMQCVADTDKVLYAEIARRRRPGRHAARTCSACCSRRGRGRAGR